MKLPTWKNGVEFDGPHMLAPEEIDYIQSGLPLDCMETGDILELGPWLGASTHLLHSLFDPGYAHIVMDRFRWEDYMTPVARKHGIQPRADFRPIFDVFTQGLDLMVHEGNLGDVDIPFCVPKIVFLDAVKTVWVAEHIMPQILSSCPVGCIILDQDLLYRPMYRLYMMHWWMELVQRGIIEPVRQVKWTGVFRVKIQPVFEEMVELFSLDRTLDWGISSAAFAQAEDLYTPPE